MAGKVKDFTGNLLEFSILEKEIEYAKSRYSPIQGGGIQVHIHSY